MLELIGSAVAVGVLISLLLIGPVFFSLLETSITKGWRHAITLNAGVLIGDMICIAVAYYSSKDLVGYIKAHPSLYMWGGFFVLLYGLGMILSKPKTELETRALPGKGYPKIFLSGLVLNLLNIGAIVFWFFIVSSITLKYPNSYDFLLYMSIVLGTFFGIDLVKIFLARKVRKNLTPQRIRKIRLVLGFVLLGFGLVIFLKGFGIFGAFDAQIEQNLPL